MDRLAQLCDSVFPLTGKAYVSNYTPSIGPWHSQIPSSTFIGAFKNKQKLPGPHCNLCKRLGPAAGLLAWRCLPYL